MYQIIQLQPDDDLAAIRARIEISELARVILIVPRDCATLESVSGLQLLRRAADDLATPLALVAHNDYVRAHATEFGFPVFNSLTQAQNTKWRMGESKRESNPHRQETLSVDVPESKRFAVTPATIQNWRGAMIAAIIALVLLGVVAFFFVPTAQVRLVPSAVALTTSTDVIVDSSILQVTAATHSIPARRLNREISGTLQLRMTTTKTIPDARSTGNVTFSNLRAEEIAIPPGTILGLVGLQGTLDSFYSSWQQLSLKPGDTAAGAVNRQCQGIGDQLGGRFAGAEHARHQHQADRERNLAPRQSGDGGRQEKIAGSTLGATDPASARSFASNVETGRVYCTRFDSSRH